MPIFGIETNYYLIALLILLFSFIIFFRRGIMRVVRTLIGTMAYFMGSKARLTMKIFWFAKPPLLEIETYEEVISKYRKPKKIININDILPMVETGDIFTFIGKVEKN